MLGAIGLALLLIVPRLALPVSFDGAHTYLPTAARLLAEGFGFLGTEQSVMVAPLSYFYPALLGASEKAVRWSNVMLYLGAIALAFDAVRLAHSRGAGIAAAFLLAFSPTLRPYIGDVLTEPPYIFAVVLWATAISRVTAFPTSPQYGWIAAGTLALSIATLTRPSVMLFAPAMTALFAWRAWKSNPRQRPVEWRLAALHALAMVLPLAWILRNYILFGLASIATGSGAALWLGIDPLVDGFDPVYFGMDYDVGGGARDMSHLSIEADRMLRAVAAVQLKEIPFPVLAEMFARKAAALLVFSAHEMGEGLAAQRSWRIALLVLAVAAIVWTRGSRLVLALSAMGVYMVVIHLPALYHHRYAVGAIDAPLTLLAAIGLANCFKPTTRTLGAAVLVTVLTLAGLSTLQNAGPGSPRVDRVPGQVAWTRDVSAIDQIVLHGATREGRAKFTVAPNGALEIPVYGTSGFFPGDYSAAIIGLAITPTGKQPGCESMRLRFRGLGDPGFAPARAVRIPVESDGKMRALVIGTTQPLHLNTDGVLRLEFECAYPVTLEMGKITLIAPRRALVYRQKWLDAKPDYP